MPSRRQFLAGIGVAGSVGLAGCSSAPFVGSDGVRLGEDYPAVRVDTGWPSPRRDAANTACIPGAEPLVDPSVDWRSAPGPRRARAAVAGATVVYGSSTVFGYDVISGDTLWVARTGGSWREPVSVHDRTAYAIGAPNRTDVTRGLVGVDAVSGERTRTIPMAESPTRPPSFPRGSNRSHWVVPAGDAVLGYDDGTDSFAWRRDTFGTVTRTLAVNDRIVVAATAAGEVYAFSLGGDERWRTGLGAMIPAPPVLGRRRVYVPTLDGVVARERYYGGREWRAGPSTETPLAFDGQRVFVASGTELVALSARTGAEAWRYDLGRLVSTAPVVRGDSVYAGTGDGAIHALSATGSHEWTVDVGASVGPALVTAGSRLYATAWRESEEPRLVSLA